THTPPPRTYHPSLHDALPIYYEARLLAIGKRGAEAEVVGVRPVDNESPLRIVLLQGIARGEKMDLVLQKATELGVVEVLPVDSEDRKSTRLNSSHVKISYAVF